jgi:uncharacterized protein (TIGR03000 family)
MRKPVPVWQGPAAALLAVVVAADTVQAQAPGTPEVSIRGNLSLSQAPVIPGGPGSTTYPYWATAPQSFAPSRVTVPVPGLSPYTISNAARSAPTQTSVGVGSSGGFTLPFMTVGDAALEYNKAYIRLRVPKSAEIWVDGVKTKQTGELRYFFSPPLTPGKKYSYQMRLRWMKDGKPVEETHSILVEAGQTIRRDFTQAR